MRNELSSIGIDIGTTTTQVIFSRLILENRASISSIPEYKIVEKQVVWKSDIYITPLVSADQIDYHQLSNIVAREYANSGYTPSSIDVGAVIITGETARKENAQLVLDSLSEFAGDFVVSTAGPDLEAVLAGWGAGAGEYSKKCLGNVVNFDIGGGTTNTAVFFNGCVIDAYALNIGGRLVRFDSCHRVTYISPCVQPLIDGMGLPIFGNKPVTFETLNQLSRRLAEMFLELLNMFPLAPDTQGLFIGHGQKSISWEAVSFSGGVAEYIYNRSAVDNFEDLKFGDIGPLLGYHIRKLMKVYSIPLCEPSEKIRATVIGAGNHSVKVSGSTIEVGQNLLPLKNLPVIKVFEDGEVEDWDRIGHQIEEKLKFYPGQAVAIALSGRQSPSYFEITHMAGEIISGMERHAGPIIVLLEHDFAKALGQTIESLIGQIKPVICLDRIKAQGGDYIDIGLPVSGVVPVVIKTLIFNV